MECFYARAIPFRRGLYLFDDVNMHDPVLGDTRESDDPDESLKEMEL
jgi:hypothetical protein